MSIMLNLSHFAITWEMPEILPEIEGSADKLL